MKKKEPRNVGVWLLGYGRCNRRLASLCILIVVAVLSGLIMFLSKTYARDSGWKIINPGAKREVVRVGHRNQKMAFRDDYIQFVYMHVISVKQAVKRGATYAMPVAGNPDAYVAIIYRDLYENASYQPIKVMNVDRSNKEVAYVVGEDGTRLELHDSTSLGITHVYKSVFTGNPISFKKLVASPVNGIKGYMKAPKKLK